MEEKYMVNDALESIKNELVTYQGEINETENMQLRQTVQQMRNNCESFQYELFKVAESKEYYKPAQVANPQEISKVKTDVNA